MSFKNRKIKIMTVICILSEENQKTCKKIQRKENWLKMKMRARLYYVYCLHTIMFGVYYTLRQIITACHHELPTVEIMYVLITLS